MHLSKTKSFWNLFQVEKERSSVFFVSKKMSSQSLEGTPSISSRWCNEEQTLERWLSTHSGFRKFKISRIFFNNQKFYFITCFYLTPIPCQFVLIEKLVSNFALLLQNFKYILVVTIYNISSNFYFLFQN